MRRADRLFQLIQYLRHDRVITARDLAESLEVSERTIYRDVQDLSLSGVPIEGEAGSGYRLLRGFHLPPLMFTEEELAALLLGTRMVRAWTDKGLARAANQAIKKIENVIPEHLQAELARDDLIVPDFTASAPVMQSIGPLRGALKQNKKIHFSYTREDGMASERIVHPLGLFYWGKVWTLVAWCELRNEFRHFRVDRIQQLNVLDEEYESIPGRTLQDFMDTVCREGQ